MIRFRAEKNGTSLIGLGLSEENIKKLKEGMPIHINAQDMNSFSGINCEILIFYGKTEESMKKDLAEYIGPDTDIQDKQPHP